MGRHGVHDRALDHARPRGAGCLGAAPLDHRARDRALHRVRGRRNFFVKNAEKRWRITFPFGLVHGFGFAGALREVALPKADVPAALFLFNAGVELGQLAVLALVLPALALLRRRPWFEKHGVRVASAAIVVAGIVWFVTRIVSGP